MNLIRFFISFLFSLHSNWRSISLPAIIHLFTSRSDYLLHSDLLLALALTWPTFNKLLFTLTDLGTYFLDRTILYLIAALIISIFVPRSRPLRLLLGSVCVEICSPSRASVAETLTTCLPICAFS
jgi:hypothetical protein